MHMQTQTQPLDLVAVLIALATPLFGPQMAAIAGPYAAIFLGALVGAIVSAAGRPSRGRTETLAYVAVLVLVSLAVTVPAAEIAAPYIRVAEPRYLFFPAAAVISGVGDRWPGVIAWAWGLVKTRISGAPQGGQQ